MSVCLKSEYLSKVHTRIQDLTGFLFCRLPLSEEEAQYEDTGREKRRRKCKPVSMIILATTMSLSLLLLLCLPWKKREGINISIAPNVAFPFHLGFQDLSHRQPLNSTLGFGKIYVLNMPSRKDKKAEMTVLAAQYNLTLEFIKGINGRVEYPQMAAEQAGILACASAHAQAWQTFVESGSQTALIFEDDVDFDIRIREQLSLMQGELSNSRVTEILRVHKKYIVDFTESIELVW